MGCDLSFQQVLLLIDGKVLLHYLAFKFDREVEKLHKLPIVFLADSDLQIVQEFLLAPDLVDRLFHIIENLLIQRSDIFDLKDDLINIFKN